jgi:hypothetical protein
MPQSSRRLAIPLLAGLALVAPQSALAHGRGLPDAQVFATDNTAVITDAADPRLRDPLKGFAREVERIVAKGGGSPRGSQLLDGVFFSSDLGTTTFERSREFDGGDLKGTGVALVDISLGSGLPGGDGAAE